MSKTEISTLEREVNEAHQLLIELNDKYNEMLTKKHEKEMNKKEERKPILVFDIDFIEDDTSLENKEASKHNRKYYLLVGLVFLLEVIGIIPVPIAFVLITVLAIRNIFKTSEIKRKYHKRLSLEGAKIKVSDKEEMDDLYEKVCEARFNYHNLRKKLESANEYVDMDMEVENRQETVFEQYAAYIDYVKNIRTASANSNIDNKSDIKLYQLNNK